ncbi:MAG: DUF6766 family protein [Gaiellaceae bacterium]
MRRFAYENGLSLFFGAIFLVTLIAQSFAGQRAYNADQLAHEAQPLSWVDYVASPDFGGAVLENWQSEFLQFLLFILATVWLVQKGSNESKALGEAGLESDQQQQVGGYARENAPGPAKQKDPRRRFWYENSLVAAMAVIFLLSWGGQSLNNWRHQNEERSEHGEAAIGWAEYVVTADFWERTLQNWQSEFLAVGTMAVFTIYLRQRGSPESKPVGSPHEETAASG